MKFNDLRRLVYEDHTDGAAGTPLIAVLECHRVAGVNAPRRHQITLRIEGGGGIQKAGY